MNVNVKQCATACNNVLFHRVTFRKRGRNVSETRLKLRRSGDAMTIRRIPIVQNGRIENDIFQNSTVED